MALCLVFPFYLKKMIEGVSSLLNIAMPVATDEVTEKLSKMKVVKRDGRLVDFDDEKIYDALMKGRKNLKNPFPH